MQKPALEVVDRGVDWITITSTTKSSALALLDYGFLAAREEQKNGNEKRDFQFKGYDGWRCGAVSYGARHDGAIFIASGGLAREHWRGAFSAGTNCSRLDFQVTVRTPLDPELWILKCYKSALKHTRKFKRGPSVDIHRSSRGSSTVYLGSRASEKFGRIYDKGNESSLDVMQGCVRYETEFKGRAAFAQIKQLANSRMPEDTGTGHLLNFAKLRGVPFVLARDYQETIVYPKRVCDRDKQLAWVRTCVRPTVERLLADGCAAQLVDCLPVREILQALDESANLANPAFKLSVAS